MTPSTTALAAVLLFFSASFLVAAHPADGRPVIAGSHEVTKPDDVVQQACANATRLAFVPSLTMDYCVTTLRSDKRAAEATHPRDLALVAMDLLERGAADAKLVTVATGKLESQDTVLTVRFCHQDYDAVARATAECRPVVQGYKPGGGDSNLAFYNYMECGSRLSGPALACWGNVMFDEKLKKVALKEVQEAANRGNLVDAMIEQMVGILDGHGRH